MILFIHVPLTVPTPDSHSQKLACLCMGKEFKWKNKYFAKGKQLKGCEMMVPGGVWSQNTKTETERDSKINQINETKLDTK